MHRVSAKIHTTLILLFLSISTAYAGNQVWPLKGQIDLSSGFGDFRPRRFHAGVDLRTGGKIGAEIFSPVDGHVWRVKMSYYGYGKGLYIKGKDGAIYVFGHLNDFAPKIDKSVKAAQVEAERYYVDLYYPKDSIPVKSGELIAYSGQTGSGAPHLHFEKRTAENYPVNPLRSRFKLKDKTKPTFTKIGFQQVDDSSLFTNGHRKQYFAVSPGKKPGKFALRNVPYFNRPFGVLSGCFDQMRAGGMRQAVYKLTLEIDKKQYYRVVFDSLDFATGTSVNLNYDYLEAVNGDKRVRRMFYRGGNEYRGVVNPTEYTGIVDFGAGDVGLHHGKLIAEDCFGNKSELKFSFYWGVPGDIYNLDSADVVDNNTLRYFFTPVDGFKELQIDSVVTLLNRGTTWHRLERCTSTIQDDGRLLVEAKGSALPTSYLRLALYTKDGTEIRDNQFSGLLETLPKKPEFDYEIVDDGIEVTVRSFGLKAGDVNLCPMYQGEELGQIRPSQITTMQEHNFFVPPDPKYARIDRFEVRVNEDTDWPRRAGSDVSIFLVNSDKGESITIDSILTVRVEPEDFFVPSYIGLEKNEVPHRRGMGMNSDHYIIHPEAMVTRSNFKVIIQTDSLSPGWDKTGICWLDEDEDRWVWLDDNVLEDKFISAGSQGGGSFAAVLDRRRPKISQLTVVDGWTYRDARPSIQFKAVDSLSGIRDDTSIVMTLDGKWLIPEYDFESDIVKSMPHWDLANGKHQLKIAVTDRAGNKTEQKVEFFVQDNKAKRK